ncbi:hypothetical protein M8J77_010548 [Diaphorina citri]|nr:hypothetical protein M8J77_010548 [Diaphorina citri]
MAYFENITDNVPQMSRSINSESHPPLGGSLTDSCRSLARLRSHQRNAICRRALEEQDRRPRRIPRSCMYVCRIRIRYTSTKASMGWAPQ